MLKTRRGEEVMRHEKLDHTHTHEKAGFNRRSRGHCNSNGNPRIIIKLDKKCWTKISNSEGLYELLAVSVRYTGQQQHQHMTDHEQ